MGHLPFEWTCVGVCHDYDVDEDDDDDDDDDYDYDYDDYDDGDDDYDDFDDESSMGHLPFEWPCVGVCLWAWEISFCRF